MRALKAQNLKLPPFPAAVVPVRGGGYVGRGWDTVCRGKVQEGHELEGILWGYMRFAELC